LNRISDPDVLILASCSRTLKDDYSDEDNEWIDSPFAWIKTRPSRQVGVIGEKLVASFLATKGFDVVRSPDSQADRVINGSRAEIKFSTLWQTGSYRFQQLRDQDYQFAICLGVSPFDAHCWIIPKKVILEQWGAGNGLVPQHGGQAGRDTAWLTVTPGREPDWLAGHGGQLSKCAKLVEKVTGKKPLK
jgi:hypothetical protein